MGKSTLRGRGGGGAFGHFEDMYVKYIVVKHVVFNFGFHFRCLGLIFDFHKVNDI
jgi:hypothetical protein